MLSTLIFIFSLDLDSGLSLTTVRDATEFESDQESKENSVIAGNDSTTQRSLITKRAGDTDSDEVFVEVGSHRSPRCFSLSPDSRRARFYSSSHAGVTRSERFQAASSTTTVEKTD